jgi:hypothetical protein
MLTATCAGAVTVSAVLLVGVAACTSAQAPASPTSARRPTGAFRPTTSRAGTTGSSTGVQIPHCRASQLTARVGESGPAAGTEYVVLLLRNIGGEPCRVSGLLPLLARVGGSPPTALPFRQSSDPAVALIPADGSPSQPLEVGHYAAFIVSECLADECARRQPHYTQLIIDVGTGQFLAMTYPTVLRHGRPGIEGPVVAVPQPTSILGH